MRAVTSAYIKRFFPKKPPWSCKGEWGKLLVIGGSRRYSGSPAFSALAAYRAGCDLVTIYAPERAADIAATFCPDIIAYPVKTEALNPWNMKEALEFAEKATAVVIGGGLERSRPSLDFVNSFLERNTRPSVIDADAIAAVSERTTVLKNLHLVTPHPREFESLTGIKPSTQVKERADAVQKAAKRLGCTILLKGHVDIISDGKDVFLNRTGNPCMTKGGTGDALAGIAGALLSRGIPPLDAGACAAYINGRAGDLAAKEKGFGLMASDLLDKIPLTLK